MSKVESIWSFIKMKCVDYTLLEIIILCETVCHTPFDKDFYFVWTGCYTLIKQIYLPEVWKDESLLRAVPFPGLKGRHYIGVHKANL